MNRFELLIFQPGYYFRRGYYQLRSAIPNWVMAQSPMAGLFFYLLFALSPIITAPFALIDDHLIVDLFDQGPSLSFKKLAYILFIQPYLNWYGRFAPLFNVLKHLEIFIVGNHPFIFHLSRVGCALFVAWVLTRFLGRFMDRFAASICTLLYFSGVQTGLWLQIFDAEVYGLFFWAIALLSLHPSKAGDTESTRLKTYGSFFFWLWIGTLNKEPFLGMLLSSFLVFFVLLPLLGEYVGFEGLKLSKRGWKGIAFFVFLLLLINSSSLIAILLTEKTTPLARGWINWRFISPPVQKLLFDQFFARTLILLLGVQLFYLEQSRSRREILVSFSKNCGLAGLVFLIFFIPQWIFYGNILHEQGRYMAITMFALTVIAAIFLRHMFIHKKSVFQNRIYLLTCLFLLTSSLPWAAKIRLKAHTTAEHSSGFQSAITQLSALKMMNKSKPFLFCSDGSVPEKLESIMRYARFGIQSPYELAYIKYNEDRTNGAISPSPISKEWIRRVATTGNYFALPKIYLQDTPDCCIAIYVDGPREACHYKAVIDLSKF